MNKKTNSAPTPRAPTTPTTIPAIAPPARPGDGSGAGDDDVDAVVVVDVEELNDADVVELVDSVIVFRTCTLLGNQRLVSWSGRNPFPGIPETYCPFLLT